MFRLQCVISGCWHKLFLELGILYCSTRDCHVIAGCYLQCLSSSGARSGTSIGDNNPSIPSVTGHCDEVCVACIIIYCPSILDFNIHVSLSSSSSLTFYSHKADPSIPLLIICDIHLICLFHTITIRDHGTPQQLNTGTFLVVFTLSIHDTCNIFLNNSISLPSIPSIFFHYSIFSFRVHTETQSPHYCSLSG